MTLSEAELEELLRDLPRIVRELEEYARCHHADAQ